LDLNRVTVAGRFFRICLDHFQNGSVAASLKRSEDIDAGKKHARIDQLPGT
jgi:hypothetical protein